MTRKQWRSVVPGVVASLLLAGSTMGTARAQNQTAIREIQALRQELEALRERSRQMERKLEELLEKQQARPTAPESGRPRSVEPPQTGETEQSEGPVLEKEQPFRVHGAVEFGYRHADFAGETHRDRVGDASIAVFRVEFDGEVDNVILSGQYYLTPSGRFLRKASLGYRFNDTWRADVGVLQVPFGKLPYPSHDWWWGLPYYMGYEDDYDAGVQLSGDFEDWALKVAYFKNDEYGDAGRTSRYSIDVIQDSDINQENMENNQFNLHLVRNLVFGDDIKTELGGSLQWGQLYNASTRANGNHWAGALHLAAEKGPFNVILEGIRYEHNPKNPAGISDDAILLGGQGASFLTAAKGWIWDANLRYSHPVSWGPVKSISIYDNYSLLDKDPDGWANSHIHTIGTTLNGDAFYITADYVLGKNAVWIGDPSVEPDPMAAGTAGADWNDMFLLVFGYYF